MTWRRAGLYWACFLVLAAYYVTVLREPGGSPRGVPVPAGIARAPFIDVAADQIAALELRREDGVVRCRRRDGRWRVVKPAGAALPSDLMAALVANLTAAADVQVVAENAVDLAQFGLAPPVSQIRLIRGAGESITVFTGMPNPAGTAVYAQRADSPRVFLIGLNIRYYEDLLSEALSGK